MSIQENILKIRQRVSSVCSKLNRNPAEIKIVAVSKGRPLAQIAEAAEAGIIDIGENKVQEALLKYNDMRHAISDKPIRWHMVGHLQTNKVRDAVKIFDLIHSVDSLHLAEEINKQAAKINKVQEVLIEIKTSSEATKFGFLPEEAVKTTEAISHFKNINIKGLMTIASVVGNPEQARPCFKLLRELRDNIDKLITRNSEPITLSMGMTDDFEIAIEEGANTLRIGRAIFEG